MSKKLIILFTAKESTLAFFVYYIKFAETRFYLDLTEKKSARNVLQIKISLNQKAVS